MPLSRDDAAGMLGAIVGDLTDLLNHLQKGTYDADAHNACIALVEFHGGNPDVTLFAYSDSSKMNKKIKGYCEIPASGEREIAVTARPGGRLRIAARDAAGTLLPAACVVRDEAGTLQDAHMTTRYGRGGAHSMQEGSLGTDGVLARQIRPLEASCRAMSVKVPPMSTAIAREFSAVILRLSS